jgi:hypothetical protein
MAGIESFAGGFARSMTMCQADDTDIRQPAGVKM